jgi:hypothetical protein
VNEAECGGSTGRAEVPWVQLQPQQGTEAAHRAEGPAALQAEDPGADAMDTRNQPGTDDEGTRSLFTGLEELLRLLSDTLAAESSGGMDTASVAIHALEAMETREAAVRAVASTWGRQSSGRTNGGSPHGPWHLANSPALSYALPIAYFDSLGLPRLVDGAA